VLALRLRELDSGTEVHDSAVRECDLAMQAALADQRSAEAAIEKQRAFHHEQTELVNGVQARYYEIGAEISRTEQTIDHTRQLRERQKNDLAQSRGTLNDTALHIERDEKQLADLRAELEELEPQLETSQLTEESAASALADAEAALQLWQQTWEDFNRSLGAAHQTTQVERARIEQLENQLRRFMAQADRLHVERETLAAQSPDEQLAVLAESEAQARLTSEELADTLARALEVVQSLRSEQITVESRLEQSRSDRERKR
jgi:chromosome segregation protein